MLRWFFRIAGMSLLVLALTVATQVGGVVFMLACLVPWLLRKRVKNSVARYAILLFAFAGLYVFTAAVVLPRAARSYGRVPMPWVGSVRPLTWWTCVFNRHYVTPSVKELLYGASDELVKKYPGTKINYLDAGFPLFDKFPLWPHLSHSDGKKIDIAFFYLDSDGKPSATTPSVIGYGVFEGARPGEENYPERCRAKGFWQYDLLGKIVPQGRKKYYTFDAARTAELIRILGRLKETEKIFLEPHLKQRMKLTSEKIRYHGCQAVRHDDHVHWQVKGR